MKTQPINLFIVDDDNLLVLDLKVYLKHKFGEGLNITTFNDGESCLAILDKETHIVILDYFMSGKNGLDVLKAIKTTNPKTEVIMLSTNEEIAVAVEAFRSGAKDYVVKGEGYWKKILNLVGSVITKPIRVIVRGFK